MIWLQQNWIWLLVGLVFIGMHLGHGSHGGHGHGRRGGQQPEPRRAEDDRDSTREAEQPVSRTDHLH